MTIEISDTIRLELIAEKHAQALFNAVDGNREHIGVFMPWVGNMLAVENTLNYIKSCEQLYAEQKEVSFVIIQNETLVGRIGIHYINQQNKNASIGYWLVKDAVGKGIITRSCIALISYGFKELGLHRIEIKAAVGNYRSRAIPEKLQFKKEGILREAELVNNKFLDLFLYAMLASEWGNRF